MKGAVLRLRPDHSRCRAQFRPVACRRPLPDSHQAHRRPCQGRAARRSGARTEAGGRAAAPARGEAARRAIFLAAAEAAKQPAAPPPILVVGIAFDFVLAIGGQRAGGGINAHAEIIQDTVVADHAARYRHWRTDIAGLRDCGNDLNAAAEILIDLVVANGRRLRADLQNKP